MARDWMADLWPSSFRGVPFWTEKDKHGFGKRLVVHQFPGRDDPFLEDLGQEAQIFTIVGYLASDVADQESDALMAALLPPGPGILVLPAQGPVNARFHKAERDRERDKAGYFAFQMTFYKEGASTVLTPLNFLAQRVFDANDAMLTSAATLLASMNLQ